MADITLSQISTAIAEAGADWVASQNPISRLSSDQIKRRLGVTVDDALLIKLAQQPPHPPAIRVAIARRVSSVDWRNHNGMNAVSPIREQGDCGSCVAFAVVATLESKLIQQGNQNPDLSEADLFFCLGAAQNRDCDIGWLPGSALDQVKAHGVSDEACFPYPTRISGTPRCSACAERDARAVKATEYRVHRSTEDMKDWLANHSPAVGCFLVYSDFPSYRSGIYKHVTGDLLGGHAVEIVGYSDADQCWICKNSWGTRWGENGFFRIGYGQCRIDSGIDPFSFYGIEGVTLPSPLNIDWYDRTVFDVDFYVRYQSDFQAVFGDDPDNARNHWLQHGIKEGRRGSREFDVKFYIDNNDDVKAAFGADYPSVFNQWYRHGMKEGRRGSREFDVKFYIDNNDDIKAAFGNNYVAAIDHWIKTGLPIEGRRGSEEFDVKFYLNHNHDLQVAFGNNYVAAIDHWIKTGSSEHRTGAP